MLPILSLNLPKEGLLSGFGSQQFNIIVYLQINTEHNEFIRILTNLHLFRGITRLIHPIPFN